MTATLLALVLVAAAPGAAAKDLPRIEVLDAGQVEYDVAKERGVATGGVVLRRGLVVVRAERASYDLRTGEIDASGDVLLTEPGRILSANAMHLVLDGPFQAHGVVAFMKDAPLDLSRCTTLEEGRRIGRNKLTVRGQELDREPPPPGEVEHYEVERARVTLCDCGGGLPSWEVRSTHADVIPGKRALLTWPVFYIAPALLDTQVPVFVFPVMYMPLGDRQSGLLFPEIAFGGVTGFGVSLPLYLTLGRSWDATITADYIFGPTARAAKGPGTSLELRWAPVEGMHGTIKLSLLHSQLETWPGGVALPPGWNRIALSAIQEQRVSDRTYYRLELGLIDDPLYLQDFTGDALLRATEYRRSALAITHRTDDAVLAFDAAYHLPLAYLDSGGAPYARAPFGTFGADLSTFHRLPSASVTLLPLPVAGPIRVSGTAAVSRFAPLRGSTGDEGQNGVGPGQRGWGPGAIDAGERDGIWNGPSAAGPGERLAATRALVRAEARAPVSYRSILDVEPWVGATAAAYSFQEALSPQVDARAVAGLALSTRIGRTFGSGPGRLRHEIEPRIEWRGGTANAGPGLPNYAYDEFDVALPARVVDPVSGVVVPQRTLSAIPGAFSQLQLSIRNRLIAPAGPLSSAVLDVALGQDLDVSSGRASETWAKAALSIRNVMFTSTARFRAFGAMTPEGTPPPAAPSSLDSFTELSGGLLVVDGRGDNVHAGFIALGAGASPRVLAGLEPFFDPRPTGTGAIAQGSVGFTGRWSGANLTYDALFYAREPPTTTCASGKTISASPHVFQHQATLTWDSPCRCWKAGVSAVLNECDDRPRWGIILDFSSIGGRSVGFGG